MKHLLSAIGLSLCLIQSPAAFASASDNTLTVGIGEELPSFDGYFSTSRDGVVMTRHIFDMLVYRDPANFEFKPLLATSWKRIDDRTWEFALRKGVTFHDGSPFNADDVVFTLSKYADPKTGARSQVSVSWIEKVEKVDDYTVRVVSKKPYPVAIEYLAGSLPIYPSDYYEKVGKDVFGQKPIGTGPYKFVSNDANQIVLEAYDGYYKDGGKGTPAIKNLKIRIVPDTATRIAEVIGGGIDWIWNVPADQVAQLEAVPTLKVALGSTMRIAMIGMDAAGRTGADNPLTKLKVRLAINHAIDRKTIVKELVGGDGEVVNVPCYPKQFGCDTSAAVVYDYDPAKAKALLAEAGYPNGFSVKMTSYRDRSRAEAVQAYLGAIGIKVDLEMLQARAAFSSWREAKVALWYGDWGSFSIGDSSASMGNFYNGGSNDGARDPEIIELMKKAQGTVDEAVRKEAYSKAIKMATEKAYWVPMHTIVMGYAYNKDLNFTTTVDELPRFFTASWK